MAQVSVSEAARLVGRDRKSLYRAIKQGRLSATQSATGERQIDIAELVRVYGNFGDKGDRGETVSAPQRETVDETAKIAALQVEIANLRERLVDKERHIDDIRNAMRLLEHKTEKKRWWKWWPASK